MKKNRLVTILVFIVLAITLVISILLFSTIKEERKLKYSLKDMKVVSSNIDESVENNINNVEVIGFTPQYINATIESISNDCTTIAISIVQEYKGRLASTNSEFSDYGRLTIDKHKIIGGNIEDFIIEVTFTSNDLDSNSNILKGNLKEGKNRPLFRTRFHIRKTDKPATYELVEVGENLSE